MDQWTELSFTYDVSVVRSDYLDMLLGLYIEPVLERTYHLIPCYKEGACCIPVAIY